MDKIEMIYTMVRDTRGAVDRLHAKMDDLVYKHSRLCERQTRTETKLKVVFAVCTFIIAPLLVAAVSKTLF